jgi:hypothetical protein
MGKVASAAVRKAIRDAWPGPVPHLHTLRQDHLRSEDRVFRGLFAERGSVQSYIVEGFYWSRRLNRPIRTPADRWQVVTLVREPVARNLSTFFQTLDAHRNESGLAARIRAGGDANLLDDLETTFIREFDHGYPLTWFDREIATTLGIDVFAQPFDPAAGCAIYENDRTKLLLLRVEDLARVGETALRSFLGLPDLHLEPRNVGEKKYYAAAYRELVRTLRLPEELLDRVYCSRLARHFYSERELVTFRERWSAQAVACDGSERAR